MNAKQREWPRSVAAWQILTLLITLTGLAPTHAAAADWTSTATASPGAVSPGGSVTLTASVTSAQATTVHVQVSAYDEQNTSQHYQFFFDQVFAAGETKQFPVAWTLPSSAPLGIYRVKIGVFTQAWSNPHWNDAAAPFTVTTDPNPTPEVPTLPQHLGLGVIAANDADGLTGWMPDSGIPWDYAYAYLAGGVNTGSPWQQWSSWGTFPLRYAKNARANGYLPVFTYYEMLQTQGPCSSCGEAQKDLAHLNDVTLMTAYFEDFKVLMQRLGPGTHGGIQGFGKTAIVHIEPDLSAYANQAVIDNTRCYGFCTGQGDDPSYLTAAVASTGLPELAGLPNTYQGYSWALLKLRDQYAPNVLLAFHVSNWASKGYLDSTSDDQDAVALGTRAGLFAARSGVVDVPAGTQPYALIFNDVSDRDAGYIKYSLGKPGAFWDATNLTFPNYARWQDYLEAVLQQTPNKKAFIWQIPVGNQYFSTMNNTTGHWQDNRVEYFLTHTSDMTALGVTGLLFGHGETEQVAHYDRRRDGITQGTSFCTTDGLGSGQVCNTHTSTVSDDDGGFLRMKASDYYQQLQPPAP